MEESQFRTRKGVQSEKAHVYVWWLVIVLLLVNSAVGCNGPTTSPVPTALSTEEYPVPGATPVRPEPEPTLPSGKCGESPFMWPVDGGLFKWAFRDKKVCYSRYCIPELGHQGIDIYAPSSLSEK